MATLRAEQLSARADPGCLVRGVRFSPNMSTHPGTHPVPPVKRSEIFGWCCFDFANSSFTTIIITVVYSVYFQQVVAGADPRGFGWWGTAVAISQGAVIVLSPWIGALADYTARKKKFLLCSALICSICTAALFFAGQGDVGLALSLVVLANFAFGMSENLCASFLPEISTPENVGRISGYGWSFGYLGGLLSLILALVIIGDDGGRVPWTFVMTGCFFLLACLPTFLFLRERGVRRQPPPGTTYLGAGWASIAGTFRELPQHKTLAIFFAALTFFMAGLMAIVAFAALFGSDVLHLTTKENLVLFAVLQITSALGAFAFGFLQDRSGPKLALLVALAIWLVVSAWAAVCQTKFEFYLIGALAGIGMGSLQSASRAVVASLTPAGRSGEFFGFWGLFGKLGGVIGTLIMGWMATQLGFRNAVLANGVLFLIAMVIVATLRLPRATRAGV